MDKKEILKNNKILANFIGRKGKIDKHLYTFHGLCDLTNNIWIHEDKMLFHSSWDWLKIVVNKIGDLIETGIYYHPRIINMTVFSSIDDVYRSCIEFIKYYNEQKIRKIQTI